MKRSSTRRRAASPIAPRLRGWSQSQRSRSANARRVVGRHDETADAVLDHLGQTRHGGADRRQAARHPLEQRLPEQFRHCGLVAVDRPVDARQHDAQRSPVAFDQRGIVAVVAELDALARASARRVSK